ncbi:MAG: hypothetical protein OXH09_12210 [Gammaproteobacteria bacterium]|nr:hypothetical protein [Gammaproteobacteria bacterium]
MSWPEFAGFDAGRDDYWGGACPRLFPARAANRDRVDLDPARLPLRMFGRLTRDATLSLSSQDLAGISARPHAR